MQTQLNRHLSALAIKAATAIHKEWTQGKIVDEVLEGTGITHQIFSNFLNRKLDLLPEHIFLVLDALGLDSIPGLSASAEFTQLEQLKRQETPEDI